MELVINEFTYELLVEKSEGKIGHGRTNQSQSFLWTGIFALEQSPVVNTYKSGNKPSGSTHVSKRLDLVSG